MKPGDSMTDRTQNFSLQSALWMGRGEIQKTVKKRPEEQPGVLSFFAFGPQQVKVRVIAYAVRGSYSIEGA